MGQSLYFLFVFLLFFQGYLKEESAWNELMIYCVLLFVSALAFSSGLGTTTTLMMSLKAGDHVICMSDVYGGKK